MDSSAQHEDASVEMLNRILKNEQVKQEFINCGLSIEEHRGFIGELIKGKPSENSPQVSILLYLQVI